MGFDRTRRGSGAVDQYRSPLREQWGDPSKCPEDLLLWFHRLPWDHRLKSGRTLWEELVRHYEQGAEQARAFEARWRTLQGKLDEERFQAVLAKLRRQAEDAAAWRDKCVSYFRAFREKETRRSSRTGARTPGLTARELLLGQPDGHRLRLLGLGEELPLRARVRLVDEGLVPLAPIE